MAGPWNGTSGNETAAGGRKPLEAPFDPAQIGLGAFYYIASAPIIGVMNYAGTGRTEQDMTLFFGLLVLALTAMHLGIALSERLRRALLEHAEPYLAIYATVTVLLAALSAIPAVGYPFFIACAILTGLTCATAVGMWVATPSIKELRPSAFHISPAMMWAVAFYLVYRLMGFASDSMSRGWLIAVALIGMISLLLAYSPDHRTLDDDPARKRSFLLLGLAAIVFAVAAPLLGYVSGSPDVREHADPTWMVAVEAAGALLIGLLCSLMRRAHESRPPGSAADRAKDVLFVTVPLLVLGYISGTVVVPGDTSNFLWEASVWVLVLGIFIYGMRTSLFAVRGLAIGLMWEAWCVGQMTARMFVFAGSDLIPGWIAAAVAVLAGIYLVTVVVQVVIPKAPESAERQMEQLAAHATDSARRQAASLGHAQQTSPAEKPDNAASSDSIADACVRIGNDRGLSAREIEVLILIGEGRTARYIADELCISFNTARSHIRHIYEKLDIHSKQELISLIQRAST